MCPWEKTVPAIHLFLGEISELSAEKKNPDQN
jgi:hypothetical protein